MNCCNTYTTIGTISNNNIDIDSCDFRPPYVYSDYIKAIAQKIDNLELNKTKIDLENKTITKTEVVEGTIFKVIFHPPATIVYWSDGSKTIVKAQNGESFDKEKGLAMAIVKRVTGNTGRYNEVFKEWCKE